MIRVKLKVTGRARVRVRVRIWVWKIYVLDEYEAANSVVEGLGLGSGYVIRERKFVGRHECDCYSEGGYRACIIVTMHGQASV